MRSELTHVINRKQCDDIVGEIKRITGGGANYSIDTSGVPDFVRKGLHCLAPMGVEVVVGITPPMEIDMFGELMAEGKTIAGVIEGAAVPEGLYSENAGVLPAGQIPGR